MAEVLDEYQIDRLLFVDFENRAPMRVSPKGTYLLLDQGSKNGKSALSWLVKQGAQHIVVVGEREPEGSFHDLLKESQQRGVSLHFLALELTSQAGWTFLKEHLSEPIHGLIYLSPSVENNDRRTPFILEQIERLLSLNIQGFFAVSTGVNLTQKLEQFAPKITVIEGRDETTLQAGLDDLLTNAHE